MPINHPITRSLDHQILFARLEALFGGISRLETGEPIVGAASRLLPVRVHARAAIVDLFLKQFVPTAGTAEEIERLERYVRWESERITQAAAALQSTPGVAVPRLIASYPDLLALVTERAEGRGLDDVLRRLAIVRSRRAAAAAHQALARVAEWIRRFQNGVPVRNPAFRKDYREYLDIRLRALVAAGHGFTAAHRQTLLAYFDERFARICDSDVRLVPIHADLCPANVLVGETGITVLDLAMSSDGNRYVDVAHLDFHVKLIAWRWRLQAAVVRALEDTLLREFDPGLQPDQPMLALMRLQHAVCHLAALAPRATSMMREQTFRRKVRWITTLIG